MAQLFPIAPQLEILLTHDNEWQISISILYLIVHIKRERVRTSFACQIVWENVVEKYKNYALHCGSHGAIGRQLPVSVLGFLNHSLQLIVLHIAAMIKKNRHEGTCSTAKMDSQYS